MFMMNEVIVSFLKFFTKFQSVRPEYECILTRKCGLATLFFIFFEEMLQHVDFVIFYFYLKISQGYHIDKKVLCSPS